MRRKFTHLTAMAGLVTLAGMMLPGAAAHASPASPDARAVCGAMKVGYASCLSLIRTDTRHYMGISSDATPSGYGPSQLRSAYSLPSATAGGGQTVAIVDAYDDPNAEADLQIYRAQYGLPVCDSANGCFQKLNQDGLTSPLPPAAGGRGWDVEESLDIEMVSAICPNCHITLVEAKSNYDSDLYTAEDAAVATGAKFVSDSWASCEFRGETADDTSFNHPGVVITAAGGDAIYDNGGLGCNTPSYPAASQYVTSVGGTSLTQDPSSPRGWDETAWAGTGSGCSHYESKPVWQTDTGCAKRTTDDVSAVADPGTGVAVYDTYSRTGWVEVGGTSVATPVIASTYALAGTPVSGTNPSSYPYAHTSLLNDVTAGSNGKCTPAYLCTAGPGYDGPTGLGTPDGTGAFQGAPSGVLSGQVTSSADTPVAGATVSAGSKYKVTTGKSGDYAMTIPDGSYQVTAQAWGHAQATQTGVRIRQARTTTADFALTGAPSTTVSGTITDGSGHGWPLYAEITIPGDPHGPVYTNPYTGHYSLPVTGQNTYTLHITPVYPGYTAEDLPVTVGITSKTQDAAVALDRSSCIAPGYAYQPSGTTETFTGWTGTTPRDGWTNVDYKGKGQVWAFNNPAGRTPPPGGDADFAIVDSDYYGSGATENTSLVSPVVNMSAMTSPDIGFDTDYSAWPTQTASVDLSLDGGKTWSNVWQRASTSVTGHVDIPIPPAAGQADVRVRFHFTGSFGFWWAIDNVFLGNRPCAATPGGLLDGIVTSYATSTPVNGATVASVPNPAQAGVSAATPDPSIPGGFYWLFASPAGKTPFTAAAKNYATSQASVNVVGDKVTQMNWVLKP